MGEGTGGDGKAHPDEDEHRRYGYKDPVIQVLCHSYIHIWGTKGEHIEWWRRMTGGNRRRRRRRRRRRNICFRRTMMMSLIWLISSTGV